MQFCSFVLKYAVLHYILDTRSSRYYIYIFILRSSNPRVYPRIHQVGDGDYSVQCCSSNAPAQVGGKAGAGGGSGLMWQWKAGPSYNPEWNIAEQSSCVTPTIVCPLSG